MRILNAILIVAIACHAGGCSRSDSQNEVDKARAETQAARADAAAAKAELAEMRAASPKAATEPSKPQPKTEPAVNPTTKSVMKGGLDSAGVATFPDGKKRPFATIRNLDVSSGQATVVGIVGGGERELSSFKFYELLPQKGEPANKGIGYKERNVQLHDLSRISFGLEKQRTFAFNGIEFEMSYCDVELEATDGKTEGFPCILADYPHHRPLAISVQYADGIGKEALENTHLYGMTFRAGE